MKPTDQHNQTCFVLHAYWFHLNNYLVTEHTSIFSSYFLMNNILGSVLLLSLISFRNTFSFDIFRHIKVKRIIMQQNYGNISLITPFYTKK